jgi:hypothetical protein
MNMSKSDATDQLKQLDALPRDKQSAFLGLFAAAWSETSIFVSPDGEKQSPHFGKYECEQIEDWEGFYTRELPELGWIRFIQMEQKPALGMASGWTYIRVAIEITEDGRNVREAYWRRVNERADDA